MKNIKLSSRFYGKINIEYVSHLSEDEQKKGYVYVPYIFTEHTEESLNEYNNFKKEYHNQHKYCPICGEEHYITTLVDYFLNWDKKDEYKDLNRCECVKCGNIHSAHDRVASNSPKK